MEHFQGGFVENCGFYLGRDHRVIDILPGTLAFLRGCATQEYRDQPDADQKTQNAMSFCHDALSSRLELGGANLPPPCPDYERSRTASNIFFILSSLTLRAYKKQDRAGRYRPHPCPGRDVDRLLFLDRQLERTQLGFVGLLGVAELAVHHSQEASHDQHDCHDLDCAHLVSFLPWTLPQRSIPMPLQGLSSLNDIDQYHHDRDDQENMNESSHCVRADQAKEPEDKQNDCYRPEHISSPPPVNQGRSFPARTTAISQSGCFSPILHPQCCGQPLLPYCQSEPNRQNRLTGLPL